ncbi:hypothetical protein CROQUDRAFT_46374, partial [Cronartium quercuum f. sp. fusiforme G11]
GHKFTIAMHPEFKNLVEKEDIKFADIGGSPTELVGHCVESGECPPAKFSKGHSPRKIAILSCCLCYAFLVSCLSPTF